MNETTMTRRTVLAGLMALPLAALPDVPAPEDDEPIWDFEIDDLWGGDGRVMVSALERGSIPDGLTLEERYEQDAYGSWMFRWPRLGIVEQMGYRAYCDWMIGDEYQEGRVGTVTVRDRCRVDLI